MRHFLSVTFILMSTICSAQLPDIWDDNETDEDIEREYYYHFTANSSIDFGYGYTQSFRSLTKGVPSDYLIGFQTPYHTLHFNFEYGFNDAYNWFIWAGGSVYLQIEDREELLKDAIPDFYPNYVVKKMNQLSSEDSEGNDINADRSPVNWSFGAGYQINKRRFAINMKAGMSITAIPNLQTRATLKELNSNNYYELSYYVLDNPISNGLGINAALTVRYVINPDFGLFIAADFNRNWYDWEYEEEFYDIFTGEATSTFHEYDGFLDFYQIRAGVSVYLGN